MTYRHFPMMLVAALVVTASTARGAEVPLPNSLGALADDPNDANDDANAFSLSPSGRFRFSQFVFSPVGVGTTPPGENDIQVSISESGNSVSLTFEFQANGTAVGPGAYELALEYLAEVLDPALSFTSHTLAMEGTTGGNGLLFINEEILVPGIGGIGTVTTTANVPNLSDVFSDTLVFSPTRMMTVHNKDISVNGGADPLSQANLVRIVQTFQVIPEPSSYAIFVLGLLGLGLAARRFHRTK